MHKTNHLRGGKEGYEKTAGVSVIKVPYIDVLTCHKYDTYFLEFMWGLCCTLDWESIISSYKYCISYFNKSISFVPHTHNLIAFPQYLHTLSLHHCTSVMGLGNSLSLVLTKNVSTTIQKKKKGYNILITTFMKNFL